MGGVAVLRLEFSGSVLGSVNSVDMRDLCQLLLGEHQAICTRFDIALDDFTKSLWTWDDLKAAARAGNYAGPLQHDIRESAKRGESEGMTVYFGSRRSEAFYRFYDKSIESDGEVDSYRMELELKRSKAHQAFTAWLEPTIGNEEDTIEILRGFLMGNIQFLDRSKDDPNLDRLDKLPFWAAMVELLGQGVKLSPVRAVPTIERCLEWLQYRVFPSIYAMRRALGDEFDFLIESFMHYGQQHQNKRHDSLVAAAHLEGWGCG
jgi:phage replication initiation protein